MAAGLVSIAAVAWAAPDRSAPAAADAGAAVHAPGWCDGSGPHGAAMGAQMLGRRGGMAGRMHARMRGGRGMMGFGPRALEALDLTEAQRDRIADIREAAMKKGIQARADLETAHLDLARLMRADKPDMRAIDAQVDRIATMRASLQKAHIAARLEVRSVLTPEQQEKLKGLRHPGPRGMGRGMGMGWWDDDAEADAPEVDES
jgi:Spy/CpxP family protein refolding chaperone